VAKEEIEKGPSSYNEYYSSPQGSSKGVGQTGISNFLGGAWRKVRREEQLLVNANEWPRASQDAPGQDFLEG